MPTIGETFFARDRAAWRTWLERHHARASEIWLVLNKKHVQRPCVSLDEAVEEALCFGWIDGVLKRIDDEKHALRFSPRRPGSVWSVSNKARVRRLRRAGRMTEAGLAAVRAAKTSGEWDAADRREQTAEIPADLSKALAAVPRAATNFRRFAPSHRKQYLYWIESAKRPATRTRRIAAVVRFAQLNQKPGIDTRVGDVAPARSQSEKRSSKATRGKSWIVACCVFALARCECTSVASSDAAAASEVDSAAAVDAAANLDARHRDSAVRDTVGVETAGQDGVGVDTPVRDIANTDLAAPDVPGSDWHGADAAGFDAASRPDSATPCGQAADQPCCPGQQCGADLVCDVGICRSCGAVVDPAGCAVRSRLEKAVARYLAAHTVVTTAGVGSLTLEWAYGAATPEVKVDRAGAAVCGAMPTLPAPSSPDYGSALESLAGWRACSAVASYMLMLLHRWLADDEALFVAHGYNVAFQIDSLSADDTFPPAHGLPGAEYRLASTNLVRGYLPDFGMGVLSGLGWHKAFLPQTLFAVAEARTIDFHARIAQVASSFLRATDSFRSYRSDAQYLARSSAGRALAAVLTGDAALRFARILEANDYVSREFGLTEAVGDPVPSGLFGYADNFQHLGVVVGVNAGVASDDFRFRAGIWRNIFFGSYFASGGALVDLDSNVYVKDRVAANYPADFAVLSSCPRSDAQPLKAFTEVPRTVDGKPVVLGIRGESAGDAIITSVPGLYQVLRQAGDGTTASAVLQKIDDAIAGYTAHWPLFSDEVCVRPTPFFRETTGLMSVLREFAYLYFARQTLLAATYQSFGPRAALPPPVQAATAYVLGSTLTQAFWRANTGYSRAVPIVNGTPDFKSASSWSAPVPLSALQLPGCNSLTSAETIVTTTSLIQGVWCGEVGYARTVPLTVQGTEDWGCVSLGTCPWSAPLAASSFPGAGPLRAASDTIVGSTLIQGYWRDDGGYSRSVPLLPSSEPDWTCESQGRCPWSGPFSLDSTGVPGSGQIEGQAAYVTGNHLSQEIWRGGRGYARLVPVESGVPRWSCAGEGRCPFAEIAVPGFP